MKEFVVQVDGVGHKYCQKRPKVGVFGVEVGVLPHFLTNLNFTATVQPPPDIFTVAVKLLGENP